jgi:hypothetical protein
MAYNDLVSAPPDQVASNVARVYAWNVRFVNRLAQIYGFKTLFYWQPRLSTKDLRTPYERQVLGEDAEMGAYYQEATRATNSLLSAGDSFHDISGVFRGDPRPYFIDNTHLTGTGNEVVARRMLQDIVPLFR